MTWALDIRMSDGKVWSLPFDYECEARMTMNRIRCSVSGYSSSVGRSGCSPELYLKDYGVPDVILFVAHITSLEVREVVS